MNEQFFLLCFRLQDNSEWIELLRRSPQAWSVPEVAVWVAHSTAEGGAGMAWLAPRLMENCIDGSMLLSFTARDWCILIGLTREQERHALMQV